MPYGLGLGESLHQKVASEKELLRTSLDMCFSRFNLSLVYIRILLPLSPLLKNLSREGFKRFASIRMISATETLVQSDTVSYSVGLTGIEYDPGSNARRLYRGGMDCDFHRA